MFIFFFFKQKTAYEMRISDWSSDVCSSDLYYPRELVEQVRLPIDDLRMLEDLLVDHLIEEAVGRNVHTITNNYARAWIDLNRRETELDPRQPSPRPAAHIDQRSPRVVAGTSGRASGRERAGQNVENS